ncbi:helix-turn-helix domain-containing protein [Candidatus Methylomirabilis sp.]|uniref:helix-turn-helix domain-containing protein n=1 Tax=Candidatus Methylomirabilis sp. TaxID=2032687 RepID=UPI003C7941D8
MQTKQISLEQAAERLSVSPRSLSDRRYRVRLGLAAVRIGRRLTFSETDIDRLIMRGRESLPGAGRRRANVSLTRCCSGIDVRLSAKLTLDLSTLCFLLRLIASALC